LERCWNRQGNIHEVLKNGPLTDAELDRVGDFLIACEGDNAMNLEELDGFFATLIAGPEMVMPSEYHREVFGGDLSEACGFTSSKEADEIMGLMMRHWNSRDAVQGRGLRAAAVGR
jgi:uncharacterized protein